MTSQNSWLWECQHTDIQEILDIQSEKLSKSELIGINEDSE